MRRSLLANGDMAPAACAGFALLFLVGGTATGGAQSPPAERTRPAGEATVSSIGGVGLSDCIPAHVGQDVCSACHRAGRIAEAQPYAACADCHADAHQGQLRDRPDGGNCSGCHDVRGFETVIFGVAEHRETEFPLEGAHRAVPCRACHKRDIIDGRESVRLKLEARECADCHTDPPKGHVVELAQRYSCKDCHTAATWNAPRFDHDRTEFKLTGRHTEVACSACHPEVQVGTANQRVRYVDLGRQCADCHEDVHHDQFAAKQCSDCHTPESWKPVRFDHQKDSSFTLEGKHREADCRTCHRLERGPDEEPMRRFKPLSTECRGCHAEDGSPLPTIKKPSVRLPVRSSNP